jgi:hypothetical protein
MACGLLFNCSALHSIKYPVDDVEPGIFDERFLEKYKDKTFNFKPFHDKRRDDTDKRRDDTLSGLQFKGNRLINEKCVNAEVHYHNVSRQIAKSFASHLSKKGVFKKVYSDSTAEADFYLTGTLDRFYGEQWHSKGAAAGSQFGLVGALATMGITTTGTISIQLSDLKLYDKNGNLIGEIYNLKEESEEQLNENGHCTQIFLNVDAKAICRDTL